LKTARVWYLSARVVTLALCSAWKTARVAEDSLCLAGACSCPEALTDSMLHVSRGELIGEDENGNRYYENKMASVGHQRFVLYPHRKRFDPSSITPEWHGWLHAAHDETPNEVRTETDARTHAACCFVPATHPVPCAGLARISLAHFSSCAAHTQLRSYAISLWQMNMRRYPWQRPPVNRLDYLSQYAYQPEWIPKGAYVRRTGIVQPEEHPPTVAATTKDPYQLKPRISVVQVNSTVTPLTEEPDAETNPFWEREKKKRMLAHPNPVETFCPTGEHLDPHPKDPTSSANDATYDDPNHLAEVAKEKKPFHGVVYLPWKPIPYLNADDPYQPVEVGARPYHAPPQS
jgi:NADH:ubiquinone oxidoreductase subunit